MGALQYWVLSTEYLVLCSRALEVVAAESARRSKVPSTQYSVPSTEAPPSSKRKRRSATIKLRTKVQADDCDSVRQIVEATGLFRVGEIDVAVELVQGRLEKGSASGYEFIFAEQKGEPV